MPKVKNRFFINIEYWLVKAAIFFVDLIPLRTAYLLSGLLARIVFVVDRKHRNRTIQHILHSGIVKNRGDALTLARRNYQSLSKTVIEIFKLNKTITPDNIGDYISVNCPDQTRTMSLGENKTTPIIALTAHLGDWEFIGITYAILAKHGMLSVMRAFDNPRIGDLVTQMRIRDGHYMCTKDGALKSLMGALRKGDSVGLLIDQHAGRDEGVETTFFGHPARTHASPAMLHLKTGAPIFVAVLRRISDGPKFEMVVKDPIIMKPTGNKEEDIKTLTQLYTTALEELIRETPEQWLWAHRRWLDINRKRR